MLHTSSISGQAVFPSPSDREETGQQDVPEHYPERSKQISQSQVHVAPLQAMLQAFDPLVVTGVAISP